MHMPWYLKALLRVQEAASPNAEMRLTSGEPELLPDRCLELIDVHLETGDGLEEGDGLRDDMVHPQHLHLLKSDA